MSGTHEFDYPQARREDLTEEIAGHQVSDPYRWMEEAGSTERADWLAAEAELFAAQQPGWPGRDQLAARVRELLNVGYEGTPAWRGDRRFFTRREPGQEHGVLYTQLPGESARVLLDPMAIDASGLTTLDAWQPDKEGRLLASQLSEGGSEESLLRIIDVETGALVDGPIDRCRYSSVGWLPGGKAFYYTRRLAPDLVPDGESQYHRRVYLHEVGTPADQSAGTGAGCSCPPPGARRRAMTCGWPTCRRPTRRRPGCGRCRRAWTRRPRCGPGGTAGSTCSPISARRGPGSRWPTRGRWPTRRAGGT
jgi:protease II